MGYLYLFMCLVVVPWYVFISADSGSTFYFTVGYCYDVACNLSNIGGRVYVRVRVSVRVIFSITWPRPDTVTYV